MRPAVAVNVSRMAVGGVRTLRSAAVTIEAKLHMDTCNIRDRAPCPIALDPICGRLLGHDRLQQAGMACWNTYKSVISYLSTQM